MWNLLSTITKENIMLCKHFSYSKFCMEMLNTPLAVPCLCWIHVECIGGDTHFYLDVGENGFFTKGHFQIEFHAHLHVDPFNGCWVLI